MTVYVTGDIHGGLDMQKLRDWELGDSLTSDDYLIVAGDFGFPWDFSAEECTDIAAGSRPIPCCSSTATTNVSITGRSAHGVVARRADAAPVGYLAHTAPDARRGF
ncbi:MAG: hypothetical protein ACLS3M_01700 [Collinsella sp.]